MYNGFYPTLIPQLRCLLLWCTDYFGSASDQGTIELKVKPIGIFRKSLAIAALSLSTIGTQAFGLEQAGTQIRQEVEYKSAYVSSHNQMNDRQFKKSLGKNFKDILNQEVFLWPQMLGYPSYESSRKFVDMIFQDTYFDTEDLDVLRSDSSYRLRYRFNPASHYYKYQLLPFLAFFQPSRVEIQAKTGYEVKGELMNVNETRFEFRNESLPFSKNMDAPLPPWPEHEYEQYAMSGQFRDYIILPLLELKRHISARGLNSHGRFIPKFKLVTTRFRSHLSLSNPWGKPPNDKQVMIVSIDRTKAICIKECPGRTAPEFYELEVEIDRNILTTINQAKSISGQDIASQTIRDYSSQSYERLRADQEKFFRLFRRSLHKSLPIRKLSPSSKYARWHHWLYPDN